MVEFAGWEMPLQYSSIVEEHVATRTRAGIFDISHMGRLAIGGRDATVWLDRLLTTDVLSLVPGRVRYSLVTNEQGGTLDDVLVYRLPEDFPWPYLLVVNAANRQKIARWFLDHAEGLHVQLDDLTFGTAMVAVQGPEALAIAAEALTVPSGRSLDDLRYYRATTCLIEQQPSLVSRTGYSGEDGVEIICSAKVAVQLWENLLRIGQLRSARPAGLGARDTLRLEAGLPLYGHELDETISPLEARLDFAVALERKNFVGREALLEQRRQGLSRVRVGLVLAGRRIARQGHTIEKDNRVVGIVTSGTFGPYVQQSIAMGYVPPALSSPGTEVQINVRGHLEGARIVELPFYRRRRSSAAPILA
jgi:aminomethyltransferase